MPTGFVALVGAGPGDAGLLTLKGAGLLARAQAVVYDRLVSPGVLARIPAGVQRIDVGKSSGSHPVPQEEINRILVQKAHEGLFVVRLKGGDPFLFGRGGEELAALKAAGVPFCVVPGVPSALAALAYAGIPATERGEAVSLHVVTGHTQAGEEPDVPFGALVQAGGTLVFLMAVETLPRIAAGLLAAGMPGDTPAAVVENGTLPTQRRIEAPLDKITGTARAAGVRPPAVLAVGAVCAHARAFGWFERLPLFGVRVAVTLPQGAQEELAARLAELGAEALACPCTRILPPANTGALDAVLRRLSEYAYLVFTSRVGVESFFTRLRALGRDARTLKDCRVAAIAPRTAARLADFGILADVVPERAGAEALAAAIAREAPKGARVLLWRSARGEQTLPRALRAARLTVEDAPAYRTVAAGEPGAEELAGADADAFAAHPPDYALFASASAVQGFLARTRLAPGRIRGVCIGASTAAACARAGIAYVTADRADFAAMLEKLQEVRKNGTF